MKKQDQLFYTFLDGMLKRKKGQLYEYLGKRGYTPSEFSIKAQIDLGNLSKMNQLLRKGSVGYWVKIWRAL